MLTTVSGFIGGWVKVCLSQAEHSGPLSLTEHEMPQLDSFGFPNPSSCFTPTLVYSVLLYSQYAVLLYSFSLFYFVQTTTCKPSTELPFLSLNIPGFFVALMFKPQPCSCGWVCFTTSSSDGGRWTKFFNANPSDCSSTVHRPDISLQLLGCVPVSGVLQFVISTSIQIYHFNF